MGSLSICHSSTHCFRSLLVQRIDIHFTHRYIIKEMATASKILAFILLLAVFLMFTGLLTTAAASIIDQPEKSCCDECNKNESQSTDHCSTPDCPMFLCLSANVISPFTLSELSGNIHIPQFAEQLNLESPAKPIFHPPVIV